MKNKYQITDQVYVFKPNQEKPIIKTRVLTIYRSEDEDKEVAYILDGTRSELFPESKVYSNMGDLVANEPLFLRRLVYEV